MLLKETPVVQNAASLCGFGRYYELQVKFAHPSEIPPDAQITFSDVSPEPRFLAASLHAHPMGLCGGSLACTIRGSRRPHLMGRSSFSHFLVIAKVFGREWNAQGSGGTRGPRGMVQPLSWHGRSHGADVCNQTGAGAHVEAPKGMHVHILPSEPSLTGGRSG